MGMFIVCVGGGWKHGWSSPLQQPFVAVDVFGDWGGGGEGREDIAGLHLYTTQHLAS